MLSITPGKSAGSPCSGSGGVEEAQTLVKCLRCGVCCTRYQPRLTAAEVKRTARGLRLSVDDFLSIFVQVTVVGYLLRQSEEGCVFLTWEENKPRATCSIYPFRPDSCRDWIPSLSHHECREGLLRLKTGNIHTAV
ncbi:YkgJ family cysteine cluster protein [Chloroflexota bacterium]